MCIIWRGRYIERLMEKHVVRRFCGFVGTLVISLSVLLHTTVFKNGIYLWLLRLLRFGLSPRFGLREVAVVFLFAIVLEETLRPP